MSDKQDFENLMTQDERNMKTDTPRTTAATLTVSILEGEPITMVPVVVSEEIERELNAARAEICHMVSENGNMYLEIFIVRHQRDRLAEALELFLSRVQYNSVFMDGKPRGGTFDYRSSGFDGEVEHAYKALAAVKGDKV